MKHFCSCPYGSLHYLCNRKIKGVDSRHFTFEPGLRQPLRIDEMLVHTIIMLYNMVKP